MAKPHVTRTYGPIHFEDLDPKRFEDLVRQLIYDFKDWKTIEGVGRAGDDSGFDIRAYEKVSNEDAIDSDEESVTETHPMEGNLWMIQGKREKEVGPKRVKEIVDEIDKKSPPYGYILAASANFSKESQDIFREELRKKGVMEFYLWGKSELEGLLYQPKNDRILFTFFGVSLVSRRRSRTTEIRAEVLSKNRAFKALGTGRLHQAVLVRDINDSNYPHKDQYKDFKENPRWKEYRAESHHPRGTWFNIHKYYAYIDREKKEWDFTSAVDLLHREVEDEEERKKHFDNQDKVRDIWEFFPKAKQAYFVVDASIAFENMLIIDEKGDSLYEIPHIYSEFQGSEGPFRWWWERVQLEGPSALDPRNISLKGYKRVEIFPKKLLKPKGGKLLKGKTIELDPATLDDYKRHDRLKALYDSDGRYAYLNPRDIVHVPGAKTGSEEVYFQVTHKYRSTIAKYLEGTLDTFGTRRLIEQQLGGQLDESQEINIYEFKQVYSWSFQKKKRT